VNGIPWNTGHDYNKKKIPEVLLKALKEYESVAFLVIKDDSIRYERYWDNYGKQSFSNSFSMAKSIIGILIGIAIDEGKIKNLDEPVCSFLPEFCTNSNRILTIRHLITMSSGLNWDEGYTSLTSPVTRSYYDTDLKAQMLDLKVITPPGKNFEYMSCNTQLLGFIIEKATGQTVSEYASDKLWKPIQAERKALWSLDGRNGSEKAFCCFYSNARDFARIGKLFLQEGKWNNRQIVSENWVRESITPAPLMDGGFPNKIYGLHWWLTESKGSKVFYARGILGQYIFAIPGENIIIVRLGHKRGEKDVDGELPDMRLYLDQVLETWGNKQ
jgi:CubicO group peptidase (beta-lactamase class C family)